MVTGTRMPYHINQASSLYSDLITVLRVICTVDAKGNEQRVTIYQQEGACGEWIIKVGEIEFKDLSLNRAIERAGRSLTTVYDR